MSSALVTRPAYRPYVAEVAHVERLAPHFARITFTCPEFVDFGTSGLDQRLKLVFPAADGVVCDIGQHDPASIAAGEWYTRWRALPAEERTPFRTYTVRRIDPASCILEIDFVLHHDPGPAGAWAEAARPGDEIVIVGPDQRADGSDGGIDWHPGTARRVLLVGDETATPAISGILESLGAEVRADAFIEVPTVDDILPLSVAADVHWVVRAEAAHGEKLIEAVSEWAEAHAHGVLARAAAPRPQELEEIDVDTQLLWESPEDAEGEFYAWIAGESQTVKTLRRLLVQQHGVDRKRVAFMGYWRAGVAERVE